MFVNSVCCFSFTLQTDTRCESSDTPASYLLVVTCDNLLTTPSCSRHVFVPVSQQHSKLWM